MTELVIETTGLRCRYGSFEAVRGVDLAVRRGELFALLGTNGAGKTTTMETLEGHRAASAGTVRVLGMDPVVDKARLRPRVGIMLQESGFAGELTVAETVELWRSVTTGGAGDRRGRFDVLDALDLAHRSGVMVKQLSGGEKRRLDLALAVLTRPELLFLDEPTTGLDPESRRRTWDLVRALRGEGTTVLLTTHYLEEAEELADRLAIMHRGVVAVEGTLGDVLATEPSRISFLVPDGLSVADLPGLPSVLSREVVDGRVELSTADLQQDLGVLVGWANARGVRLPRLRASQASLEDVFHNVRGMVERAGVAA
ncbi:ABC transporter ATP-binding protein [Streptoalloteichus tenebrarius]|uniref:ABC transporter ATP-binding protein n=1 Tax=Streptoalloteichus tenebrarius (strain ATCC 17920 / DSM 40477 / JCM 4838 / CBS 697.72 / NBRC 16177 / NCIMB 11028 / NRRL B-12390 / A12253. 1 / ISP 5477) TaxID=1933 RepID=UPI0020A2C26D|nr:ABC transporter ATP-binding protein [Streptoalloteichus tenebrarius]BFF01435.1 ABC transporter ATP-binding protein [Streptoalloteichus tenebrarius]